MKKQIIIGSRRSRLAEIQARSVLDKLASIYPEIDFTLSKITTTGDQRKTTPVDRIPGFGAFVKELEEALLDGRIDLVTLLNEEREAIDKALVACIGQETATTATKAGLRVDIVAQKHTIPGLIEAMEEYFQRRRK